MLKKYFDDMIAAGYRIYPNLYKFEQYGVPQARHRMIIVGIRNDLPFEFKISVNGEDHAKHIIEIKESHDEDA